MVSYELIFKATGMFMNMSFTNATVTATGRILDWCDLNPSPGTGSFAATTTYNIGGIGNFSTDVGADFFAQHQFQKPAGFSYGLRSSPTSFNSTELYIQGRVKNPVNIPQAIGAFRYDDSEPFGAPRTLTNNNGDVLVFHSYAHAPPGNNVIITAAP